MKRFLILALVVCTMDSYAQFSFPAAGVIKVNQTSANGTPSIAVRDDGSCWIMWGNASQWMNPDLSFDGNNSTIAAGGLLPAAMPGGALLIAAPGGVWAKITRRETDVGDKHYIQNFEFDLYENQQQTIKSPSFFETRSVSTLGGTGNLFELVFLYQGSSSKEHAWISYNIFGSEYGGDNIWNSRGLVLYNFSTRSVVKPIVGGGYNGQDWFRGTPSSACWDSIAVYGIPTCIVSGPRDDRFILISRAQQLIGGSPYPSDPRIYFRKAKLFSVTGDSLIKEILLDSVHVRETDLSDEVVLGDKNDFFIIRRSVPGDTLFREHFSLDGKLLDRSTIATGVRTYSTLVRGQLNADYNILALPDGRFVLAWTKMRGSSSDVFALLLDENMMPVGNAKRINSDTTISATSPKLGCKGDAVYVTWTGSTDTSYYFDIYLRRFRADQITAIEEQTQPVDFGISTIHPNPLRDLATISYRLPHRSDISIKVYDVFGRTVATLADGTAGTGCHSAQFNTANLHSGTYRVVFQSDKTAQVKTIVVMK